MPLADSEPPGGCLGESWSAFIPPGASATARRCLVAREAVSGHASRGCHTNVIFVFVCLFCACLTPSLPQPVQFPG